MNGLINFESEVLEQLMRNAKVRQSRWLGVVLGVTDGAISVVNNIKRLSGGSYPRDCSSRILVFAPI